MNTDTMTGMWTCASISYPDQQEIIVIDEKRKRIFCFTTIGIDPIKHLPMRLWYEIESPTKIRTKIKPKDIEESEIEMLFEGDKLILTNRLRSHECQRLSDAEKPSWLDIALFQAHLKMDEQEK